VLWLDGRGVGILEPDLIPDAGRGGKPVPWTFRWFDGRVTKLSGLMQPSSARLHVEGLIAADPTVVSTFTVGQRQHLNAVLRRLVGRADLNLGESDDGDRLLRLFHEELSSGFERSSSNGAQMPEVPS
jgi:hypothetical protein